LRCGRQRNGLRDHLFDFRLCAVSVCAGLWLLSIPRRRASEVRQLVLKVPIGYFALISGSYGPKHVGGLAPWLQTQDAAVAVYRMVLPFQVQCLTVRNIRSRLTSPLGNQYNPSFFGYLVLEISERSGYARRTIFIRLDAFSFPPPDTQCPLL